MFYRAVKKDSRETAIALSTCACVSRNLILFGNSKLITCTYETYALYESPKATQHIRILKATIITITMKRFDIVLCLEYVSKMFTALNSQD